MFNFNDLFDLIDGDFDDDLAAHQGSANEDWDYEDDFDDETEAHQGSYDDYEDDYEDDFDDDDGDVLDEIQEDEDGIDDYMNANIGKQGSSQISFTGNNNEEILDKIEDLQKEIADETRSMESHLKSYEEMSAENAEGSVYNAKNLINDHKWAANRAAENIAKMEREIARLESQLD